MLDGGMVKAFFRRGAASCGVGKGNARQAEAIQENGGSRSAKQQGKHKEKRVQWVDSARWRPQQQFHLRNEAGIKWKRVQRYCAGGDMT
jgi:hypothetical protein